MPFIPNVYLEFGVIFIHGICRLMGGSSRSQWQRFPPTFGRTNGMLSKDPILNAPKERGAIDTPENFARFYMHLILERAVGSLLVKMQSVRAKSWHSSAGTIGAE